MEAIGSATWRKSSYSGGNGGNCVEAGTAETARVLVRDTTDRRGPVLSVPASAWSEFLNRVR